MSPHTFEIVVAPLLRACETLHHSTTKANVGLLHKTIRTAVTRFGLPLDKAMGSPRAIIVIVSESNDF